MELCRSKVNRELGGAYFCQVRFLWRLERSFLRRLCLLIFDLRRFLSDPIFRFFGCAFVLVPSAGGGKGTNIS